MNRRRQGRFIVVGALIGNFQGTSVKLASGFEWLEDVREEEKLKVQERKIAKTMALGITCC